MKKLYQTRIHNPPTVLGNCFPTVIACFLDLTSPEDAIQIQESYKEKDWDFKLQGWLMERGWKWGAIEGHLNDGSFYTVTGKVARSNASHICIYQNGKLYHDPNISGEGLITEDIFETIIKHSKICFKCDIMKPMSEYYKHKQTADGTLGKCKVCTKVDTKNQTEINISTPDGLEKERKRHRDKYHRLGYKELQKEWDINRPWKNTQIYKNLSRKLNLEKGLEAHHWNYNEEYLEDIFVLNIREHRQLHNSLILNIKERVFYLEDGKVLDTKEKHKEIIEKLGFKIHKI